MKICIGMHGNRSDNMKTLVVYDKNTGNVSFTQSINDTEDVEYNFIIADVPDNRVVARVENGVTNSHK